MSEKPQEAKKARKTREVKPKVRRPGVPLTLRLVADELNCSVDHVKNLIAAGHLAGVRVPSASKKPTGRQERAGRWIVLPADLDKAIQSWRT